MTAERLPWFPCYPGALLGALSAMEPDEGYVYVVTLLRIYEVGGPIADDEIKLARRTGLTRKRTAQMITRLCDTGKLIQTDDGRLDNPVAAAEIAKQNALIKSRSETAAENVSKRWAKAKQKQGPNDTTVIPANNDATTGDLPGDTHLHRPIQLSPSEREATPAVSMKAKAKATVLIDSWEPSVDDIEFARSKGLTETDIENDQLKFRNYWIEKGTAKKSWSRTWQNWVIETARKLNRVPLSPAAAPRKSTKVFAQLGTPAWQAWEKFYRSTKGIGAPQIDLRWPDQDAKLRRGWLFDTEYPPDLPAEQQFAEAA